MFHKVYLTFNSVGIWYRFYFDSTLKTIEYQNLSIISVRHSLQNSWYWWHIVNVQMSKVLILLILNAFRILKRHFFWGFSSPPKLAGKYIFIPRFNCIPRKSSVCFKITYLTTNQNLFFNFQTQYIPEKNCSLFRFEKCSIQCSFFSPCSLK